MQMCLPVFVLKKFFPEEGLQVNEIPIQSNTIEYQLISISLGCNFLFSAVVLFTFDPIQDIHKELILSTINLNSYFNECN